MKNGDWAGRNMIRESRETKGSRTKGTKETKWNLVQILDKVESERLG